MLRSFREKQRFAIDFSAGQAAALAEKRVVVKVSTDIL
jgi:hypothetical protein